LPECALIHIFINKTKITIMKLTLQMAILIATGLTALSAGHISAAETRHNECHHDRYRYSGVYFRPPSGADGVRSYDADYCYTPTSEQMATAQEQVEDYLLAVKKGRKRAATHRYISVEALRPTDKQLADYTKKQLPHPPERSQLRCVMVFDTQANHFVGSGCYIVTGKPSTGEVAKFETVSAEFVGQGTL
jgi:hypothetical protein